MSQPANSETQLIADSVDTATKRVKFFRLAFGLAPVEGAVAFATLAEVTPGQINHRVEVQWPAAPEDLPRREAQALLLGVMCLERCMPRGGQITVRYGTSFADLVATGPKLEGDGPGWTALEGQEVRHADVQYAYLAALRDAGHLTLTRAESADEITLSLTF